MQTTAKASDRGETVHNSLHGKTKLSTVPVQKKASEYTNS